MNLTIQSSDFLWVTKGKAWEFRFLSECPSLTKKEKERTYKKEFSDLNKLGCWIGETDRKRAYIACRYQDQRRDGEHSPIPHEFLIVCPSSEVVKIINKTDLDKLIFKQIEEFYAPIYNLPHEEVEHFKLPDDFILQLPMTGELPPKQPPTRKKENPKPSLPTSTPPCIKGIYSTILCAGLLLLSSLFTFNRVFPDNLLQRLYISLSVLTVYVLIPAIVLLFYLQNRHRETMSRSLFVITIVGFAILLFCFSSSAFLFILGSVFNAGITLVTTCKNRFSSNRQFFVFEILLILPAILFLCLMYYLEA